MNTEIKSGEVGAEGFEIGDEGSAEKLRGLLSRPGKLRFHWLKNCQKCGTRSVTSTCDHCGWVIQVPAGIHMCSSPRRVSPPLGPAITMCLKCAGCKEHSRLLDTKRSQSKQ